MEGRKEMPREANVPISFQRVRVCGVYVCVFKRICSLFWEALDSECDILLNNLNFSRIHQSVHINEVAQISQSPVPALAPGKNPMVSWEFPGVSLALQDECVAVFTEYHVHL